MTIGNRTMALAVAGVAVMSAACGGTHAGSPAAGQQAPIEVTAVRVATTSLGDAFEAGGLVEARTTAVISARLVAPVRELRVKAGDRVRRGEVLVVLDSADLDARLRSASAAADATAQDVEAAANGRREAEAALNLAQTTHTRIEQLFARKSATQQELDQANASLRMAEARVQSAVARVAGANAAVASATAARDAASATAAFATIRAPFDGVVSATMVEDGNMAAPGQALLRLEDLRDIRLTVRVDESRLASVKTGSTVPVMLDAGRDGASANANGTITEVARLDEPGSHTYVVKIALPESAASAPGRFGRARFTTRTRDAVVLPEGAIRQQGQVSSVFVIDNGAARLRMVDVRGPEVVAGIVAGDMVIVHPPAELIDGRRVTTGGGK